MSSLEERRGRGTKRERETEGEAREQKRKRSRAERSESEWSARTNERIEHASNASLNRLRGVGNERVRNAWANKRREARGERREAERREKWCAQRPRGESEAMRKETRGERNARGEKNERCEKVGCREEERAVRPEHARRRAVRNGREERVMRECEMVGWTTVYILKRRPKQTRFSITAKIARDNLLIINTSLIFLARCLLSDLKCP